MFVEIKPIRIVVFDQLELPGSTPPFEALFMHDTRFDCLAPLCPNEHSQPMVSAKARSMPLPVLEYSGRQVGGDADIHLAAIPVGHDVYPATMMFPVHR
jgi:hypothetical protein